MQAIVHQVTQQAMAMANGASTGQQGQQTTPPAANVGSGSTPGPVPPYPPQARVVFTRPSFTHRMANPTFTTRGPTINLRAAVPPMMGQQQGQVNEIPMIFPEYSGVNQMRKRANIILDVLLLFGALGLLDEGLMNTFLWPEIRMKFFTFLFVCSSKLAGAHSDSFCQHSTGHTFPLKDSAIVFCHSKLL